MPHLVLEASANIVESNERVRKILQECQELLTQQLPTQLASCKSRCVLHDLFVVGDANPKNAFVHLEVKVLAGRSQELLNLIAQQLHNLLTQEFNKSSQTFNLAISVEIVELTTSFVK
ncbi:MAG: hypothetical protein RLZZ293_1016 [Pseudomonadota bacterium]|jgi:5-carboxymethyl-2-hydroxymuconate isomerase